METRNAADTVAYCRKHNGIVRAAIVDQVLEGCRGTDVAHLLARHCPGLPVLFVSGTPFEAWPESEQKKLRELPAGMASFLAKPFLPAILMDNLASLLRVRDAVCRAAV